MIASAKSWLCHTGVDRTAELLPWHPAADVQRLSPVTVSGRYLAHLRAAWDARFPDEPLARQDVVLTLPASFDEVARELTVQAAAEAGLPRVVLIEEPQAAFYAWIYKHAGTWHEEVRPGDKILVCDIGGGTCDFTLIRVRRGADGKAVFHRAAVGDHLILGGDNFDLALAHYAEQRLAGTAQLAPRQWDLLVGRCRQLKELFLGEDPPPRITLSLPAGGTRLVGGSLQLELTRDEVQRTLLDGFLPRTGLEAKPALRASGFQEFGLPYAADPAITRYLAAFLTAHRDPHGDSAPPAADPARPDIVLFNGGVFQAPRLRQRLLEVLQSWFAESEPGGWQPRVLDGDRLDLAVARGAAYYGMVRRGEGVPIAADLARSYYVGVQPEAGSGPQATPSATALCLVPASAAPGQEITLDSRRFQLAISQPIEFPLYVSSTRLNDNPGDLLAVDRQQLKPLPPIRTVLRDRGRSRSESVTVQLHGRLNEIGTLDLWCRELDGPRTWRMQFDVRAATQTDVAEHMGLAETQGVLDEDVWDRCGAILQQTFGPQAAAQPASLIRSLTEAVGADRQQWPASLLRRIWEALQELADGRRRSPAHEARWLNLLGFALRPGYGLAVDDWRVAQTWRQLQGKLCYAGADCQTESWILWRRIAGGLSAGQQRAVAEPVLAAVRALARRLSAGSSSGGDAGFKPQDSPELWRLLGSLELLDFRIKQELGQLVVQLLPKRKMQAVRPALIWTLGRLAARRPVYGPLNTVLPPETILPWLEAVCSTHPVDTLQLLSVMQMARRTHDRYRDLPDRERKQVLDWLQLHAAPQHYQTLVEAGGLLDTEEQSQVFGEALPVGLRVVM